MLKLLIKKNVIKKTILFFFYQNHLQSIDSNTVYFNMMVDWFEFNFIEILKSFEMQNMILKVELIQ